MSRMKLVLDIVQDLRSLADSLQTLCDALVEHEYSDSVPAPAPAPAPNPTPAAPEKKVSLEEVRAVLAEKSHDGLTAEVRELLQKYGASKLSGVDPQHYAALLKDAEGLTHAT